MAPSRELTNAFLLSFSGEHVAYELEMFFTTAAELLMAKGQHRDGVKNALLESFTIHTRAILSFFYPTSPKPDDTLAKHFMPDGISWDEIRPILPTTLSDAQRRVNKEIAHLTYARADVHIENKPWEFSRIIVEVLPIFQSFARSADSAKLHENFHETGNRWLNEFVKCGVFRIETK